MPVRNLVALSIALLLGFFFGLVQALERLTYSHTLQLGEVGLAITLGAALLLALGVRAPLYERAFVAFLRAGLSGALFVFMYEGMRLFAKLGHPGLALASWAFAWLLGLLLARLVPAGAGSSKPQPTGTQASWSSTRDARVA